MSAYKIASISIALCSGLLLASFLMAAESTAPAPHAQMNRASYEAHGGPVAVAQMNRAGYRRKIIHVAQMNRALYRKVNIVAVTR